ncbi:hypothetical protein B0H34DRAFT_732424 [Crassisporium funariophilum]|nr:hypothetical protein B0H34DRAFT_732424 [Crassisporium funariophilum]
MDPRALHTLMEDVVHYTLLNGGAAEKALPINGKAKRYGAYFPSKGSFDAKYCAPSEYESTWEYSAPRSTPSRSSSTTSCNTSGSTPAQEIAILYRARMSMDQGSSTRSSSPSQYSQAGSWEIMSRDDASELEYVPIASQKDIKAAYRQSRSDALLDTYQEAMDVINAYSLGPNSKVVCQRPGCRDTLADVKALMYHLHIHDIHDRTLVCPLCKGRYEAHREASVHNCRRQRQSAMVPLRATFRRAIAKISFHS